MLSPIRSTQQFNLVLRNNPNPNPISAGQRWERTWRLRSERRLKLVAPVPGFLDMTSPPSSATTTTPYILGEGHWGQSWCLVGKRRSEFHNRSPRKHREHDPPQAGLPALPHVSLFPLSFSPFRLVSCHSLALVMGMGYCC